MDKKVTYWVEQDDLSDCHCCPMYRYVVHSSEADEIFVSLYKDEADAECERLERQS